MEREPMTLSVYLAFSAGMLAGGLGSLVAYRRALRRWVAGLRLACAAHSALVRCPHCRAPVVVARDGGSGVSIAPAVARAGVYAAAD